MAVDLIGPYTLATRPITGKDGNDLDSEELKIQCLTMIDLATRWFEITAIRSSQSDEVSKKFDMTWLCRYPRSLRCIYDNDKEFTGKPFQELLQSYGIKPSPTTVKNPQANAILERAHGVLGNMLRVNFLRNCSWEELEYSSRIADVLFAVSFSIRAAVHSSLGTSPASLVFGRDMMFPINYVANWRDIRNRQKERVHRANVKENSKRVQHEYKKGDQVMIRLDADNLPKMSEWNQGPYTIHEVYPNGNVLVEKRLGVRERMNIQRLVPYFPQ